MRTMSLLAVALVAAFGSSLDAGTARADEARIGFTTYLREGPGLRYRALDEALSDARVDVLDCRDGWCRVASGDATGYVSQGALTKAAPRGTTAADGTCFVNGIAGYHGEQNVRICAAAAPR